MNQQLSQLEVAVSTLTDSEFDIKQLDSNDIFDYLKTILSYEYGLGVDPLPLFLKSEDLSHFHLKALNSKFDPDILKIASNKIINLFDSFSESHYSELHDKATQQKDSNLSNALFHKYQTFTTPSHFFSKLNFENNRKNILIDKLKQLNAITGVEVIATYCKNDYEKSITGGWNEDEDPRPEEIQLLTINYDTQNKQFIINDEPLIKKDFFRISKQIIKTNSQKQKNIIINNQSYNLLPYNSLLNDKHPVGFVGINNPNNNENLELKLEQSVISDPLSFLSGYSEYDLVLFKYLLDNPGEHIGPQNYVGSCRSQALGARDYSIIAMDLGGFTSFTDLITTKLGLKNVSKYLKVINERLSTIGEKYDSLIIYSGQGDHFYALIDIDPNITHGLDLKGNHSYSMLEAIKIMEEIKKEMKHITDRLLDIAIEDYHEKNIKLIDKFKNITKEIKSGGRPDDYNNLTSKLHKLLENVGDIDFKLYEEMLERPTNDIKTRFSTLTKFKRNKSNKINGSNNILLGNDLEQLIKNMIMNYKIQSCKNSYQIPEKERVKKDENLTYSDIIEMRNIANSINNELKNEKFNQENVKLLLKQFYEEIYTKKEDFEVLGIVPGDQWNITRDRILDHYKWRNNKHRYIQFSEYKNLINQYITNIKQKEGEFTAELEQKKSELQEITSNKQNQENKKKDEIRDRINWLKENIEYESKRYAGRILNKDIKTFHTSDRQKRFFCLDQIEILLTQDQISKEKVKHIIDSIYDLSDLLTDRDPIKYYTSEKIKTLDMKGVFEYGNIAHIAQKGADIGGPLNIAFRILDWELIGKWHKEYQGLLTLSHNKPKLERNERLVAVLSSNLDVAKYTFTLPLEDFQNTEPNKKIEHNQNNVVIKQGNVSEVTDLGYTLNQVHSVSPDYYEYALKEDGTRLAKRKSYLDQDSKFLTIMDPTIEYKTCSHKHYILPTLINMDLSEMTYNGEDPSHKKDGAGFFKFVQLKKQFDRNKYRLNIINALRNENEIIQKFAVDYFDPTFANSLKFTDTNKTDTALDLIVGGLIYLQSIDQNTSKSLLDQGSDRKIINQNNDLIKKAYENISSAEDALRILFWSDDWNYVINTAESRDGLNERLDRGRLKEFYQERKNLIQEPMDIFLNKSYNKISTESIIKLDNVNYFDFIHNSNLDQDIIDHFQIVNFSQEFIHRAYPSKWVNIKKRDLSSLFYKDSIFQNSKEITSFKKAPLTDIDQMDNISDPTGLVSQMGIKYSERIIYSIIDLLSSESNLTNVFVENGKINYEPMNKQLSENFKTYKEYIKNKTDLSNTEGKFYYINSLAMNEHFGFNILDKFGVEKAGMNYIVKNQTKLHEFIKNFDSANQSNNNKYNNELTNIYNERTQINDEIIISISKQRNKIKDIIVQVNFN